MAFATAFRRVLNGSSILPSQFASTRLSRLTTDDKLKEAFSQFGNLQEVKVIVDRESGRSKGFGFVSYQTIEEAEKAREGMNAKYLDGWVIFVDPARPREPRPPPQAQPQPSETGFRTNKTIGCNDSSSDRFGFVRGGKMGGSV
ncbi:hypothetical protein RJ639_035275 [Escallonia herrerae]|uniref:RRM domain-containing protein n=1 Tax=Escallonia herrerae TaxID=1293975 RepID=A0AA88WRF3_9ASTE|nr:hypothetical protein RJ639_035275 [Escallonia herrerae]